ncbi:regulator of hemoglobinization and erythroid cell expansion protein isoform X2 [Rousettus aegyptiacus]|uniref:regulator of hemoglobinization and erythroid cell expansion protein isoform X2 n=1 Tax=Rousettus aegyptiacus TaxID=9407 RepID=UPI00168D4C47|nr:regulator of hemoglobinization and erythroid cell expansion protein isoform X2 [Rousettus aegyptiacus]
MVFNAKENEQLLQRARLQAPKLNPAHHHPPAALEMKETRAERSTPASEPCCRHDSDTSSVSSNTSDSSHGPLPTGQATKNVNYTQVVFSATGRLKNESDLDYENIKETTDYVNIDPQSHTLDSWTSANPAVSEPVEYTQVAL